MCIYKYCKSTRGLIPFLLSHLNCVELSPWTTIDTCVIRLNFKSICIDLQSKQQSYTYKLCHVVSDAKKKKTDFIKYDNLGFVFITGDMNCRTADEYKFILYDKYLDEIQPFIYNPDIILRRSSKGQIIDTNGYLLQLCHRLV